MTSKYSASFCDPFNPNVIELGDIAENSIIDYFEKIDWNGYLQKMTNAKQNEIHYSPSFEVENKENKNGLSISAAGDAGNYEFYIFYKRPKKIKSFFGLRETMNPAYVTDIQGQTKNDALDCLKALLRNDTDFYQIRLEVKVRNEKRRIWRKM